jgi:hypothetical protein
VEGLSLLRQLGIAAVDLEPWRPTVADVTVIGDETTHGSDLRGSRLSVLETIAPSETVLDPIPEDDDPDVGHWGWRPEIETARRACGYADGGRPGRRWRRCSV